MNRDRVSGENDRNRRLISNVNYRNRRDTNAMRTHCTSGRARRADKRGAVRRKEANLL